MTGDDTTVPLLIPADLYERIDQRANATEFGSVEDYVIFVMETVLRDLEETDSGASSEEDEATVRKKLKALGYLD